MAGFGGYDLYGNEPSPYSFDPTGYSLGANTTLYNDPYLDPNYDWSAGGTPATPSQYDWGAFGKRAVGAYAKQTGGASGEEDKGPGFGMLGPDVRRRPQAGRTSMNDLMMGLTGGTQRQPIDPGNLMGGLTPAQPYGQLIPPNQQHILRILGLAR